jgi:hypothetical protein
MESFGIEAVPMCLGVVLSKEMSTGVCKFYFSLLTCVCWMFYKSKI